MAPRLPWALAVAGCAAGAPPVAIDPPDPTTASDLVAVPPPVPGEAFAWTWRRNGVAVDDLRGDRVPAGRTARGERWEVAVVRIAGWRRSEVGRAAVEIRNAPPAVSVALLPDPPVPGAPLLAAVDALDPDGDELELVYGWEVDGAPAGVDGSTVPGDLVRGGQRWAVTVRASDGEAEATARIEAVTGNTAPRIASARIEPQHPGETDVLSIAHQAVDYDGDLVTVDVAWRVNGLPVATSPTLSGAFFHRDDVVGATVTPHDGKVAGAPVDAGEVVVVNAPPSADGVAVAPPVLSEGAVASCALQGAADPDGDPVTARVAWFVDGNLVSTAATLSGAWFDEDQAVHCEATPSDGDLEGPPLVSAPVIVENTPPSVAAVALEPDPPTAAGPVTAVPVIVDLDPGDAPVYQVDWEVNGVWAGNGPALDDLTRGDVVQARVVAWDEQAASIDVTSAAVPVANALPVVVRAEVVPPDPSAGDPVWADVAFADADGDPVGGTVVWYADGVQVHQGRTLPGGAVAPGARLRFAATPDDGIDLGATVWSAEVVVGP